jgi:hypothetical protein
LTYRIHDWAKHYENNRTRDLKRMDWVPVPNRMDGLGYTTLLHHHNGAAHLGVWLALIEIASRQKERGTLPQEGAGAFSRMSHIPVELFKEALPRLVEIGWLEAENGAEVSQNLGDGTIPQEGAEKCGAYARARSVPFPSVPFVENHSFSGAQNEVAVIPKADPNFEDWWACWSIVRGTAKRAAAVQAWLSVMSVRNLAAVNECTASYLASLDNPAKGFNPDNFLFEQARDGFASRWPAYRDVPSRKQIDRQTDRERIVRGMEIFQAALKEAK